MSYDLNTLAIVGRLTKDPESRQSKDGKPIVNFGIANGKGKDEANFIDCVAFGRTADFVSQYLKKGAQVAISGKLDHSTWTSKEGEKRSKIQIVCNDVQGIGGKGTPKAETEDAPF